MGEMKAVNQIMNKKLNMTLQENSTCTECNNPIEIYKAEIIGGPNKGEETLLTYGCKCEDKKLGKQALENRRKLHLKKLKQYFNEHSLISIELQKATLKKYTPQNESQTKAKQKTIDFINEYTPKDAYNLAFFGPYGVGKSHLAKVISDGVIEKGYTSIFISVPKLLRKIRSTYNRESDITEDDIFAILENVDVLILDDVGIHSKSDWAEEKLFDVIDTRQGKATIITTNFSPDGLRKELGEREFSRLIKTRKSIIEVKGDNYRMREFKK